jgi:hypothetical protein
MFSLRYRGRNLDSIAAPLLPTVRVGCVTIVLHDVVDIALPEVGASVGAVTPVWRRTCKIFYITQRLLRQWGALPWTARRVAVLGSETHAHDTSVGSD